MTIISTQIMKSILHLDLDSFFVSCERLLDSSLNNRPVLIGGTSNRGVVASCSYEARSFGIHSAMPMRMARQLCPEAGIIRGNTSTYSKYSDVVTDIIKDTSPMFEKASIDEFYVDTTGMDRFYGTYVWAKELRERIIKESGLPISFGLSTGKTTAKIGTNEAKPNNHIQVPHGEEKAFMAPLAIRKMPMVGEKTSLKLQQMGVQKIKTVQDMPCELMERVLGKNGISLWKKAQGIDNSPIITYHERKSISIERTFERDTTDVVKLKSIITAMSENLAYQLRNGNKLTGCVTVKIRYSDFTTVTRQLHVPYTSVDHKLINTVQELFKILYARRMLIRLIGVRYSKLVGGGYQINLFEDNEEMVRLYQAMDAMRNKYGQDAVKRAVGMGSKGIGRRNPFNGQPNVIPAHRRA